MHHVPIFITAMACKFRCQNDFLLPSKAGPLQMIHWFSDLEHLLFKEMF